VEFAQPLPAEAARSALQEQLPVEFQLLSVQEVPVSGPSLSQWIVASDWALVLQAVAGPGLPLPAWQAAAEALLAADSWIWHDTDKKGRPRQRDCRPFLQQLHLEAGEQPGQIAVHVQAVVDPTGRSLRPEQLQHWFAERLQMPLDLVQLRRLALQLSPDAEAPNQPC